MYLRPVVLSQLQTLLVDYLMTSASGSSQLPPQAPLTASSHIQYHAHKTREQLLRTVHLS